MTESFCARSQFTSNILNKSSPAHEQLYNTLPSSFTWGWREGVMWMFLRCTRHLFNVEATSLSCVFLFWNENELKRDKNSITSFPRNLIGPLRKTACWFRRIFSIEPILMLKISAQWNANWKQFIRRRTLTNLSESSPIEICTSHIHVFLINNPYFGVFNTSSEDLRCDRTNFHVLFTSKFDGIQVGKLFGRFVLHDVDFDTCGGGIEIFGLLLYLLL